MTGVAVAQCGPLDAALDTVRARAAAGQHEVEMWASTCRTCNGVGKPSKFQV